MLLTRFFCSWNSFVGEPTFVWIFKAIPRRLKIYRAGFYCEVLYNPTIIYATLYKRSPTATVRLAGTEHPGNLSRPPIAKIGHDCRPRMQPNPKRKDKRKLMRFLLSFLFHFQHRFQCPEFASKVSVIIIQPIDQPSSSSKIVSSTFAILLPIQGSQCVV